jgi:predicted transcriptional regulator
MSDHRKAQLVKAMLTEEPKPFAEIVRDVGMDPKHVRESLLWLEKHRKAEIHYGAGWATR